MMARMETPICKFDEPAKPFSLLGIDGKYHSLESCRAEAGLLVMFICNHCPYVQAILPRLLVQVKELQQEGIGVVAICSNDANTYPEDSFENMQLLGKKWQLSFPYLWDETQAVAKEYGAVCTPDFFGYNSNLLLQYRGRLDASGREPAPLDAKPELVLAMRQIVISGKGPLEQIPSMGCSIKWRV